MLLLPAFFAFTGMRTEIGLRLDGLASWLVCGADHRSSRRVGKFGGTLLAARLTGLDWRQPRRSAC